MPPKKVQSKRRPSGRVSKKDSPSDSTLVYRGPLRPVMSMAARSEATEQLVTSSLVSTNGSGVYSASLSSNPNTTSEWSSFVALYEEFRVLAMEVTFQPYYPHWASTSALSMTSFPVVYYPQRYGANVATSYNTAMQFAGAKIRSIQERTVVTIRMAGSQEAQFQNVSTPVGFFGIGVYGTGGSASAGYAQAFVRLLVQFRSRF